MLVTKPQPHLQPKNYFAKAEPSGEQAPVWVVHTKPRSEKKLARFCEMAGVGHFLPTMLRRRTYANGAIRTSWVPVFPGYVFLLQERFEKVALLRSNTIVQLMRVPRPPELYSDLMNLWMTLVAKPGSVKEVLYKPGIKVLVTSGPLRGVVGELLEKRKAEGRLLIKVTLFKRAVSVEIDASCVQRL